MKTFLKLLAGLVVLVLLAVAAFFGFLWTKSPGTTAPITDAAGKPLPGAIASLEEVSLNGTR